MNKHFIILGIAVLFMCIILSGCTTNDTKTNEENNTSIQNQPPTANIHADVTIGYVPLTVQFTGTGTDTDGEIVSYYWDFDDIFKTSNEQNPTYIFDYTGTYEVTLTVTDDTGDTGIDTITIHAYVQEPEITDHNIYETAGNTVHVVGIVKNVADVGISNVYVKATLYSDDNSIVATEKDLINKGYLGIVKPQEKSGFHIYFWDIYGYDHYDVEIDSTGMTYDEPYYDNLVLINVHEEDAVGDWFYIKGNIRNSGKEDAEYTNVYALLYDSNGKIVGVEYDDVGIIFDGETDSFSILIQDDYADVVDDYELEVRCSNP